MATGTIFSFDLSKALVNAEKLDKKISDMVANAAKLETAMTNAFSGGVGEDILKRIESRLSKIGSTKTDIHFNTESTEKLYEALTRVLDTMQVLSQGGKIELFDTKKLYETADSMMLVEHGLAQTQTAIKKLKEEWNDLLFQKFDESKFTPPTNPKTGKYYGKDTKTYDNALNDAKNQFAEQQEILRKQKEERLKVLIETEAIQKKELQWAKMTEDQKAQYIQKQLNEVLRAEQKHTSEVQREYSKLSSEIIRIYDQIGKTEKSIAKGEKAGVDTRADKANLSTLETQLREKLSRQQQIEQESGNLIIKQIEDFWVKVQERDRKGLEDRIKAQQNAKKREEEQRQKYLKSPEGALTLAKDAKTINDMKEAQKYLQEARGQVDVKDTATIKKLNDEYTRLRASIESLTTAEKNEQTLQPTIRNEYARLLKEIDKVRAEKEKLAKTSAYTSGDANAQKNYDAMLAREQDLQRRINEIKANAGNLLAETERKHASDVASAYLAEVTKAENARLEMVKRRLAEERAERSKYGSISSDSANRLISVASNATNIQQEEAAVNKLKEARSHLNQADANYDATLKKLNAEIEQHEHNIKMATDATYRKKQADEEAHKRNTTFQGAMDYSQQTKTIEEQRKAIQYLKEARDNLDKSSMPRDEYERKIKQLTDEINRQQAEIDKLTGKQNELKHSQSGLIDTASQLKRSLAGIFSVSAIKRYLKELVEVRGEFELQHRALQAIVQDVDKANKLWDKTVALAVKSPFRVKDLVTYTKQLAAYRVETENLYDTTKMLADVSAGLGVDMNRLILAYGQVKAANFLRGTELRQFTEAGIPMLDELARYFSEIEGRLVTAADVFARISKRGVSFEDVDAVFKRITGEGGIFYQMQEKQSETLKGMINNLRDSIDLMLNDIGKSQEETLKGLVSATKDIVDNWRAISVVIQQVGFAVAISALRNLYLGWKAVSLATFEGTAAMHGAAKAGATLRLGLQKLFATMKANPILFIVGALASGVHALYKYKKAIDEVNEKYDEASAAEMRRFESFKKLSKEIEKNNKVIKESNESQEEHKKALSDNDRILEEIKSKYPDLYTSIKKQEDGTTDLTAAIEAQNAELRANIALQQQAKGRLFQESQAENYKDVIEDQSKLQSALYNTKAAAMEMGANLEYAISQGMISEEDAEPIKKWIEQIENATTAKEVFDARLNTPMMSSKIAKQIGLRGFNNEVVDLSNAFNSYNKSLEDFGDTLDEQMSTFDVEIHRLEDSASRGEWLQEQLNNLGILDKEIQNWSKDYISKKINLEIVFPEEANIPKIATGWRKAYNEYISGFTTGKVQDINDQTNTEQYISLLKSDYEDYAKTIAAWDAKNAKARAEYSTEEIEKIRKENEERKKALDWLVYEEKNGGKGEGEAIQRLKKQISLIREAAKAYDDMRKLHDEAYASERIVSDYEDAFKEAGLGNIGQYDFGTREDERNNLNKLEDSAKRVKGGMLELSKAIAQVSVNIDDANQELSDKQLFDAISDIFSNYEISLEMDKLNIPPDLAEQLFGFESIDLNEIRGKVLEKFGLGSMVGTSNQGVYDSAEFKAMSKERQDELRKSLEKETELQDNALKERMNRFVKFLKDSMNEITVVQEEHANDISFASKLFDEKKIDAKTYTQVIKRLVAETNSEISKIKLEKFKESSTYIAAMGDLSAYSKKELQSMLKTLNEVVAQNAKFMSADELKAYYDSIKNISDAIEQVRMPWSHNNYTDIARILELEKQITEEKAKQAELENQRMLFEMQLKQLETTLQTQQSSGASQTDISTTMREISTIVLALQGVNGELNATSANISAMGTEMEGLTNGATGAITIVDKIIKEVYNSIEATIKMFNDVKALADSYGVDTENESWSKWSSAMDTMGNVNSEAMQGWENLKSGNVMGAIANTIGSITKLIQGINEYKDIDNEKDIKKQMKNVEKLENQYKKLEKAMEDAYTIEQMSANQKSMEQNIDAQIDALKKAKAAEEDKKNTDQDAVDEYEEKIKELEENKAELQRETVERLGGTYDYASVAEQFLDAWLEAFKETGDGLSGLEDNFDEFFSELAKKQLIYGGLTTIIENLQKKINDDLSDNQRVDNWEAIIDEYNKTIANINEFLTGAVSNLESVGLDIFSGDGSELSGLSKGIQGVSEQTAGVIEAYLNSIRFTVSDSNQQLKTLVTLQTESEENPMLSILQSQLAATLSIKDAIESVIKSGHSEGGYGVKIFM